MAYADFDRPALEKRVGENINCLGGSSYWDGKPTPVKRSKKTLEYMASLREEEYRTWYGKKATRKIKKRLPGTSRGPRFDLTLTGGSDALVIGLIIKILFIILVLNS